VSARVGVPGRDCRQLRERLPVTDVSILAESPRARTALTARSD
jgi:hypothetical protein